MSCQSPAIRIEGLGKRYRIGQRESYQLLGEAAAAAIRRPWHRLSAAMRGATGGGGGAPASADTIWALRGVTCEIAQGEVVGVIGRNGAGKSTLLKILSRITSPTEGSAALYGRVGSLLEVGTGFHPELSGRDNIYLNGIILGMRRAEIERRFEEIVAFSEIEQFLDTPVKRYSSGMYVRLAFAVAAHLEPEILIVDEVLAVGDVAFQKKCLGKIGDVAREGRTVLFVSHNMNAVQRLCPRTMLFEKGRLVAHGDTAPLISRYLGNADEVAAPGTWIDVVGVGRAGTGEAIVTALRYRGGAEDGDARPRTGGPLEVSLSIRSDRERRIGSVAITLYDHGGTKLVNADSIALGREVRLCAGENVVRVRLTALHLNPGSYLLGWWLGDALGAEFDYVEAGVGIEIEEHQEQQFGIRPQSDGIVACQFDVTETDRLA